jgi:hypothetical protein
MINKFLPFLVMIVLLQAWACEAAETPLMTPGLDGILDRAHIYKADTKGKLWVHYNLVVRDEDLLKMSREEAAAVLLTAFRKAPDKADYESAWMNLLSVSGDDTVFGKIHTNDSGTPLTDLTMFEVNQALLRFSVKLKKDVLEKVDSVISDLIDRFKEKLNKGFNPPDKGPSGEIEL